MKVCVAIRGNFRSAGARVIRAVVTARDRLSFFSERDHGTERENVCTNRFARATCNFVAVREE